MFKASDRYGDALNRYDALKLLALLTMVIDHLGMYFWPHEEWLRAIGRMAMPLFLFLVGYSQQWEFRRELLVWAGFITLTAALTHHPIFALDILVSIVMARYAMAKIVRHEMTAYYLAAIYLLCIIWFPVFIWSEYSTLALLFAVCGFLQRNKAGATSTKVFIFITVFSHFFVQVSDPKFHGIDTVVAAVAMLAVAGLMENFRVHTVSFHLPSIVRRALQWLARNTLPLYGAHMILFMWLEWLWFPQRLIHFQWYSPE